MKFLKKLIRMVMLVVLILLASVGVGLTGGLPTPASGRKENTIEISTTLEEKEEETPDQQIKPQ